MATRRYIEKSARIMFLLIVLSVLFVTHTAKTKYRNFGKIFPEKEYRGLCPNFHIHASVSDSAGGNM
jgi:hypothetical protein